MRDAEVVCRQLGCGAAVKVTKSKDADPSGLFGPPFYSPSRFGSGSGPIWMADVSCSGSESSLKECGSGRQRELDCNHAEDAGVICSGGVRLVGGANLCSGRVEVLHGNSWGTVCDADFDQQDAEVVCRGLGCGAPAEVRGAAAFGQGEGQVWSEEIQCRGRETHIHSCPTSPTQKPNCSHENDVGLVCSGHRSLRLVGGGADCAGRLEVFHRGSWGTVCDDSWDLEDAQVVCRQLQCGTALSVPLPFPLRPATGPIWLDEVGCVGNETSLWECPTAEWGQTDCGHKEDVGVVCSAFSEMRLTDGCSGKLEVFYNRTWGNVCFNQMDADTASLICQELNCGKSGTVSDTGPRLQFAPNWLDELKCRKHDSTLRQCPSLPWGQNDCIGKEVAHIECKAEEDSNVPRSQLSCSSAANQRPCTNHWPLRLKEGGEGGCSGRLEVFHNGSWGTVCDNSWDLEDAQVVCRQLGCGPAQKAHGNATFGKGKGTIWLNEVKCRGTELHLWDCPHSLKQHSSCQHQNDAGVTCADYTSDDSTTTTATPTTTTTSTTKPETNRRRTRETQAPPSLNIPAVAFVVLGALLFLLLVVLGVLVFQNRGLRRALSKGGHTPLHEAVYEEIEYKLAREGTYSAPRWGSILSEDPPSGYEDVGDSEGHSLSGELGDAAENYDDVIGADQNPGGAEGELGREDAPEHYDDVITPDQHPDSVEGELLKGDAPQHYDDVITEEQSPGDHVTEDTEQNYDDAVTLHWSQEGESILAPEGPPAPDGMDYDDVGEEPPEGGGAF